MVRKARKTFKSVINTLEERHEILSHLGYEWYMFRSLLGILRECSTDPNDPVRIALLESFMVHGRVLLDFLHGKRSYNTDWHVTDLITSPAPNLPSELEDWCKAVNKYVAHLTSDRGLSLSAVRLDQVHNVILRELQSLQKQMGDEFPSPWVGDMATKTQFTYPLI